MAVIIKSDLLKILDTLKENERFHTSRDTMNSHLHLAKEVRLSPLTTETILARERVEKLIGDIE